MGSSLAERLAQIASKPTCQLTHYGRKTGRPYEVTIWFLVDGSTVYLATMNMQRQWTPNVQAYPKVAVRIGEETFPGEVEVVADVAEMAHVVELLKKKYLIVECSPFRSHTEGT